MNQPKIPKNGKKIDIYTDGDLIHHHGKKYGGYGIYLPKSNKYISKVLNDDNKTNNRAEMMAIIDVLIMLSKNKEKGTVINIYTDSEYCILCFTTTGYKYKMKNYKKANGKYYPNHDLIKKGLELIDGYHIKFIKVKSHTGSNDQHSINNDIADKLAMFGTIQDYMKNNDIMKCQIEFGKHKGKQFLNVPKFYLDWIMKTDDMHEKFGLLYRAIFFHYAKLNNDPLYVKIFC